MNKENIQKAINVMQRVVDRSNKVCMAHFQGRGDSYRILTTEEELHECKTPACFSGWLAVSPEWKEFGGEVNSVSGSAVISLETAAEKNLLEKSDIKEYYRLGVTNDELYLQTAASIAAFLELPYKLVVRIIFPTYSTLTKGKSQDLYNKSIFDITAQDVINVLKEIKAGKHV